MPSMLESDEEPTRPGTPDALQTLKDLHADVKALRGEVQALARDMRAAVRALSSRLQALEAVAAE
jgi:hypothetical protein